MLLEENQDRLVIVKNQVVTQHHQHDIENENDARNQEAYQHHRNDIKIVRYHRFRDQPNMIQHVDTTGRFILTILL